MLDLDATDDPLHGDQEGRFFHGYYDCYCYLPLYVFCGRHLLAAKLRRSNIDASAGSVEEMERIVAQIRDRWPKVKIVLRADSRLCPRSLDDLVRGQQGRITCSAGPQPAAGGAHRRRVGEPRLLSEANPPTRRGCFATSTGRPRRAGRAGARVIAKAEWTKGEANPRFLVTSLKPDAWRAKPLYEELYCARGEMENRIKEARATCSPTGHQPP